MTDALTTGSERLAGVAAAYVEHVGPVDEHTIVTVDPEAFTLDPGVKALVETCEWFGLSHWESPEHTLRARACGLRWVHAL